MARPLQVGEAGASLVVSELLKRELLPYRPVVDDHGVDIMLSTGLKIQVKAANLTTIANTYTTVDGEKKVIPQQVYRFALGFTSKGTQHRYIRRRVSYRISCDFIILVGLTENRFWIVPSFLLDNCMGVNVGPRPIPTPQQVKALAEQGKGLKEISELLGCCETTVWKRKQYDAGKGGFARIVRMCENRWDFITSEQTASIISDMAATAPLTALGIDTSAVEVRELEKILELSQAIPTEQV